MKNFTPIEKNFTQITSIFGIKRLQKFVTPLLFLFLIMGMGQVSWGQTATNGDYRTIASGNWSGASTWQVRTAASWVATSTAPTSSANIYIQNGHTLTIDVTTAACNDLQGHTGGVVAIGTNTLQVNGKIRAYTGTAVITAGVDGAFYSGQTSSTNPAAAQITSSGAGKLSIVGSTRTVFNTGEWGGNTNKFAMDVSMTAGQTATGATGAKAASWTFTSGTYNAGVNTIGADNGTSGGNVTIANGATFTSARTGGGSPVFQRAGSTLGGTLLVSAGGTLNLSGTSPSFAMATVTLSGTVNYSASGVQNLSTAPSDAGHTGAATLNTFNNLTLSGTSAKTLGVNITVNGTLSMQGTASLALSTFSLTYGASSTLEYAGTSPQTAAATEFPSSGGPVNLAANVSGGTFRLNFSRSIAGNFTVTSGDVQNSSGTGITLTLSGASPTLSVAGSITGTNVGNGNDINLSYSNTNGTLTVSGAGTLCRFLNFSVANTGATLILSRALDVQFGTLTMSGTLQLNSGASFTTNAPTYGASSTLIYNQGGTPTFGNEWTGGGTAPVVVGLGIPQNVTIQNSTTLSMPNANRGLAGNLTITTGTLSLNGTSGDLYLNGNWSRDNAATFTNNSRAVFFVGSGTQTISVPSGTSESFAYLIANKSANNVQFNGIDVNVTAASGSSLQLLSTGGIDLNGKTLTLSNDGGSISVNDGSRTITSTATGGIFAITGNKTVTTTGILNLSTNVGLSISASKSLDMGTSSLTMITSTFNGTGALLTQNTNSTPIPSGRTWPYDITFNSASNQTIPANTYSNLIFSGGAGIKQVLQDITISGNWTINSGVDVRNNGGVAARTITMSGATPTLAVAGTITGTNIGTNNDIILSYTNTTGTLLVNGAGSLCRFQNATFSNTGATLAIARSFEVMFGTFTMNGTLRIDNGGSVSSALNAVGPTYGSSSTLVYNSGTTYGRSIEWSSTSGAGYPNNVTISSNTTINMVNGGAAYRRAAGNLTVNTGSTFSMPDHTVGTGGVGVEFLGNIINDGTISLNTGFNTTNQRLKAANLTNGNSNTTATVNLSSTIGGDLELTGNYTDNANFNANARAVFFTGTGTQTISGTASAPFNIDYIVVTKASGSVQLLTSLLTGAPNTGNALTLTSASDILDLNGNTLTLGAAALASTVSGNGFIRGSSTSGMSILGTGALGTIRFETGNQTLGTLSINRTSSGAVTLGTSLTVTTALTVTSGTTLTLGGNLTVSAAGNNSVAGIIAGTGALVKTGAGTLTLTAASGNNTTNTYSGGTTISAASSGLINVTGLTNITSTSIARDAQSVVFSNTTPTNGDYKLFPGALNVNTQSFSSNAATSKAVTLNYTNSTVTVATAALTPVTLGSALSNTYGTASTPGVSFIAAGTLSPGVTITATPNSGYAVSADNVSFQNTALSGIVNGATVYVRNAATRGAGTYNSTAAVVLSSSGATSANVTTSVSGNVVTPAVATVTATASQSKVFGEADPTFTFSTSPTVTTSGALSRAAGTNVGTYAYTIGDLASTNANYTLSLAAGTFAITPAVATVTATASQSKVFGAADPTFTFSTSPTVTTSGALSRAAGTNVGTYAYTIGDLASTNANYTLSLDAGTFAITKATPTATIAVSNSPRAFTNTAQSATVIITDSSVAGTVSSILTGGSATQTAAGSYAVTASFVPDDSTNYNTVTGLSAGDFVISSSTTTWNGTSWNFGTPTAIFDAVIDGTYSTTTNGTISAKSLTVNATKTLTIKSGTNVTIQNAVVNNGTLTIENNANLIQVNDVANTGSGTTTVKRESNLLKRLDYTMWSSPVTGSQTLFNFSPLTSAKTPIRFYTYSPTSNKYVVTAPETDTFAKGTSYLIRMPNVDPATQVALSSDPYYAGTNPIIYNGVFTGTLNNGTVTINTSAGNSYYGVGNPYPSTISANAFIDGNSITGALYFWRKTNGIGTAYATYTKLGPSAGSGGIEPNGTIQVGQGFIVKSNSLIFTNAMRTSNNDNQFLKIKKVADKSRLWLDLSDATGRMNQVLIGYLDGATLGVDAGIDGKYFNDSKTALTSTVEGEEYVIQGRPAFDATDVVALGFKTEVAGDYSIALGSFDGLFTEGQDIYLVDAVAGKEIDLKTGSYTFTAAAGVDNARFSLKYQKTLKVDAPAFNENSVKVYKNNGAIVLNSTSKSIKTIAVYDVQGRLIAQQKNVNATTATISNLKAIRQVLIVKIAADDNSVVSKKVLN